MKKVVTLFLAVLMMIAVSACGGRKINNNPTDKPSIVLRYYEAGYGSEYMEEQVKAFNAHASKGEYDFYVSAIGDPAIAQTIGSLLEQSKMSDSVVMPDVVITTSLGFITNGIKGDIACLDSVFATEVETAASATGKMTIENKLSDAVIEKYDVLGHYYALPLQAGTTGIVYNKKLFNEYGLTEPQTMAEMWELMEDIDNLPRNNDSSVNNDICAMIYPSMAVDYWKYVTEAYWGQLLGLEARNEYNELVNADVKVVEYQKYYEAIFNNVISFSNSGPGDVHALTTSSSHTLTLAAFAQQKALMTICGDWVVNEIGGAMNKADLGFMLTPLICDVNTKKVIAKATPYSEVFAGVNMGDSSAVAAAEDKYIKVERSKVDASVIPSEDASRDYIYFRKVTYSNVGQVNGIVPAKAKNVEYAKQFLAFLATDEALDIYYKKTGAWLPFNYNFTESDAVAAGLPELTVKTQHLGLVADSIIDIYRSKGRVYNLMDVMRGSGADYIVRLLQGKTTANALYNDIRSGVTGAYASLSDDIRIYEAANEITY
ncbi:MAG: extracellular solute-binding protein [Clostridia bacterium]|nr:extracellular solute-binding protein [Clostridia bacterium]